MDHEILNLLKRLNTELSKRKRPLSLQEALQHEATSLYVYYTLEMMKNKLENQFDDSIIQKVKRLEKYFEEELGSCANESAVLGELYAKRDRT